MLQKFVPNDGVYIVSGLSQLYSAGKSVQTSIARNGLVVIHLFRNENYNVKNHFHNDIEPIKILKVNFNLT